MKGKLTIEINVFERDFIEGLLNMKYSGVADNYLLLCLSLFSLGENWNYKKFLYYLDLLEIREKN